MTRRIAGQLVGGLISILGASIIAFLFMRVLPGNPARLIVGPLASQEAITQQEKAMGLDQPLVVQYWRYIKGIITGDWGFAYTSGETVRHEIVARLPASMELGLYAFLIAFVLAVLLAVLSTYRHRPWLDGGVRTASFLGLGTPPFWFGLIALLLFSQVWGIFPGPDGRLGPDTIPPPTVTHFYTFDAVIAGQWGTAWDALRHIALPAITLGLAPWAFLVRLLRANLLEVSRENFLVVVRSKGLGRRPAFQKHALPNAFLPTLTAAGLLLAQLLAGSVLVEKVFNWPGVGGLIVDSILRQDFAVVQTFVLLSAILYVCVNVVVEILYSVVDPRVRLPVMK
ncbi:MAG TPA: ABC transporter permease [Gaiellaceae bacterium]|nr:ABC transporter permease [Gaiellaceae bacterium]